MTIIQSIDTVIYQATWFSAMYGSNVALSSGKLVSTAADGVPVSSATYISATYSISRPLPVTVSAEMKLLEGSGLMIYSDNVVLADATKGVRFEIKTNSTGDYILTLRLLGGRATGKNGLYAECALPPGLIVGNSYAFTLASVYAGFSLTANGSKVLNLGFNPDAVWNSTDYSYNFGPLEQYSMFGIFGNKAAFESSSFIAYKCPSQGAPYQKITATDRLAYKSYEAPSSFTGAVDANATDLAASDRANTNIWNSALTDSPALVHSTNSAGKYVNASAVPIFTRGGGYTPIKDVENLGVGQQFEFLVSFPASPSTIPPQFTFTGSGTTQKFHFNIPWSGNYYPFQVEIPGAYDPKSGTTGPSTLYTCSAGYIGASKGMKPGTSFKLIWRRSFISTDNAAYQTPGKWYASWTASDSTEYTNVDISADLGVAPALLPDSMDTIYFSTSGTMYFDYMFSGYSPNVEPNVVSPTPRRSMANFNVGSPLFSGLDRNQRPGAIYDGILDAGRKLSVL